MPLSESELDTRLRVVEIVAGTSVDGPGFRTSIYFAGCNHRCPGCHNPSTWDPSAGHDMEVRELLARINREGFDVTLSGGDPLLQASKLIHLVKGIKEMGLSIWCYTGFLYEQVQVQDEMKRLVDMVDVLVDGPFVESLRNTSLLFRGSSNQRLIDIRRSTAENIVLWESDF